MLANVEPTPPATKRPARRRQTNQALSDGTRAVALETDAHTGLEQVARKMKVTKSKYASAAVRHFVNAGLNPLDAQALSLLNLNEKIDAVSFAIRKNNADIGNRLVGMWRTFEREMYKFLETQQTGTVNYLERIEATIVNHQLAAEQHLLTPLLEWIIRGSIDAHLTRTFVEQLVLNTDVSRSSKQEEIDVNKRFDDVRTRAVVDELRKLLTEHPMPTPTPAAKPVLAKAPVIPAPKPPAAPPAATPPAPAATATSPQK